VQGTLGDAAAAARALESAADAVTQTTREIRKFIPADQMDETGQVLGKQPGEPKGDGFKFQDVTESAEALSQTAVNLQALLRDVQNMIQSGDIEKGADGVATSAQIRLNAVIDHLAWRFAQLILFMFALLLVVSFVHFRLRNRNVKS
jgi:hypothetical protein